jgi:hypothetical protein
MTLQPPHVPEADKPLRRKVALAYREARQAGKSHDRSMEAAIRAYLDARPEEAADPAAASGKVAQMIASAVNIDPEWFWHGVPARPTSEP